MTELMAEAIRDLLEQEEREQEIAAAKRRLIERMRNAPDWGTGGRITWTREELYER